MKKIEMFLFFIILFKGASSQWSAHRIRAEYEGKFDAIKAAKEGHPVLFTGEVDMSYIIIPLYEK